MSNRPLSELEMRAALPLSHGSVSADLRRQCVEIARLKSPSAAFASAQRAALLAGFGQMEQIGVAKVTRWLAVIRRDHGQEKFEELATWLLGS